MKAAIKSALRRLGYDLVPAHEYERDAFRDQRALVGDAGAPVLDVGACVGDTVALYRRMLPKARVYAFEPFPESFAKLAQRFGDDGSVVLVPTALSDQPGQAEFFTSEHRGANSLLPRPVGKRRYYGARAELTGRMEVPLTTLDAFAAEAGISQVSILKLDIQGAELRALRGAAGLLAAQAIDVIYTEVEFVPFYEGGALFFELCSFLAGHGYGLYGLYHLFQARNGQLRYGDAVFVSDTVRRRALDSQPPEP